MFLLLTLFLTYLTNTNANSLSIEPSPMIVYGTRVRIEDYPYFAATEFCGASILSERWLLTAAHCVESPGFTMNRLVFVGGERIDNSIKLKYDQFIIHPGYTKGPHFYNDIALLRLQTPLKFSNKVKPVKLPTPGMLRGSKLTLIGRGKDETNRISLHLMKMDAVELSVQECMKETTENHIRQFMDQTLMCAKRIDNRPGACQGDSGGPLLSGDTVIGLTSFGMHSDCRRVNVSFYTNVAAFLPWIYAQTGLK